MDELNPYEAPSEDVRTRSAPVQYRALGRLRGVLMAMLGAYCVAEVGMAVVAFVQIDMVQAMNAGMTFPAERFEQNEAMMDGASLIYATVNLAALVVFGVFLHRINVNARALNPGVVTFSPASMIWWYFVPIANLFKPYQAFRQVWDASTPAGEVIGSHTLIFVWWLSWLCSALFGQGVAMAQGSDDVIFVNVVNIFSDVAGLANGLLAILVVRAMVARQESIAAELWG